MKYTMMNFILSDDYQQRVKDYLSLGLSNNTIKKIDNVYVDFKSLSIPVNLDCMNCEKVCNINCCGGAPYPPQEESIEFIKQNFEDIFSDDSVGDPDDRARLSQLLLEKNFTVLFGNRRWQPGAVKKATSMETFPKVSTGCIFNVCDNGNHKCAIHAHCLSKGINPITKKPIYCSLYPLCMIDLNDNEKFIFCILDKDITFNMWQGINFIERPCFNKGLLTDEGRLYFKESDYKPAFESSFNSVAYILGEDLSNKILNELHNYNGIIGTLQ